MIKLEHLDAWTAGRQRNAAHYTEAIGAAGLGEVVTVPPVSAGRHIFNQYVIRAERRDELRSHLAECGVGTEIYYPLPLHRQQCFAYLGHRPDEFPNAVRASAETLALPIYPELESAQLDYVVDKISEFYGR